LSVATAIHDQLKEIILEEVPHLSNRYKLQQNPPELNKVGEEFMRVSFMGGRTERVAVSTSDKITVVKINYYRVAGERANLSLPTNIKEKIIQNLPMTNSTYWWMLENIGDLDTTDIDNDKYEGFELTYEFHTAISTLCEVQDVWADVDGGLWVEDGDKWTE